MNFGRWPVPSNLAPRLATEHTVPGVLEAAEWYPAGLEVKVSAASGGMLLSP
jgi:hypothetical protein